MKLTFIRAHESFKIGQEIEVTAEQAVPLLNDGFCITASEYAANQAAIKAKHDAVKAAVIKAKGANKIEPKDETVLAEHIALVDAGNDVSLVVKAIEGLPVKKTGNLGTRITAASAEGEDSQVQIGEQSLRDTVKEYLHASKPFDATLRQGGILRAAKGDQRMIEEAVGASRVRASVGKRLATMISAGADFRFSKDIITAGTDYADPAGALGVLNTGLTLQWNLGFLANQLVMIDDITTDVSNTPVMFNQYARTRYIKVPGVQLKTSSNAWTAAAGNDVDVNVLMDTHAGVPITINNNVLGSTARQLFNEQKAPQMYGLGEYIIYKLVNTIINGSTRIANDGSTTSTIKFAPGYVNPTGGSSFNVAGATLSTFTADLPEAMDEAKFPGGDEEPSAADLQRFAWVHGRVYAGAVADTNYMLNQSIWGAVAKTNGENLLETGRFSRLGNIKFRKSQLMNDQISVSGTGADGAANALFVNPGTFANAKTVGLAGTRSSLLFVSRVPLDYTKVMPEIPSTAAIELVTEPKTGITFMVVKYLDHAYETANMRVQLMFGTAIGDERQGILLNAK